MKLTVNGKVVGDLIGTTLVKKGRQVVKMNAMDGYGVSQHLIHDSRIEKIELHAGDKILSALVGTFIKHGMPYHQRPYEPQYILPIGFFTERYINQMEIV